MSETEDDSGIDKEALREELREKYEADDQKRESTRRMSDLLLKGATMTNAHCGTCGDPIFRQNGTNFCPTCHGGPEGVEASVDETDVPQAAGNGTEPDSVEGGSADSDVDGPSAPGADADSGSTAAGTGERTFEPGRSPTDPEVTRPAAASSARVGGAGPDRAPDGSVDAPDASVPPADGDLEAARDSLRTALDRFAREAATTDDPRYARECLEAAREAADALAAMRR